MAKFLIYMHSLKLSRCLKSWHVNLKNLNDSLLLFKISFRTSVMFRIKGKFIFFVIVTNNQLTNAKMLHLFLLIKQKYRNFNLICGLILFNFFSTYQIMTCWGGLAINLKTEIKANLMIDH